MLRHVKSLKEIQVSAIKSIYDRLLSYMRFKQDQDRIFQVTTEPNDVDDEWLKLPEDDLVLIETKSQLKVDLIELASGNFENELGEKPIVWVFFYLPC